jgi:hypothetical protein
MKKFSVVHRVFLTVFILLLTGCGGSPDVQVNEISNNSTSYDETVHINNCGGKADSEQTKSHSFSTSIEGGIDVGVQQVVEGIISAKYGQYRNVSVSQRLVAPAGTNMEFVLRWSEEVRAGNVTVNGSSGTYKANIPIAVEQVSSRDLNDCPDGVLVPTQPPTNNQPTIIPNPPSSGQLCFGDCWQLDTDVQTMAWTGLTDGTEDIWQGTSDSLQKIRSGYTAIITTSVPGEIFACVLTVNGQRALSSCGLYQISAGTYQITSANNSVGGFRWCPAIGYGWRINGGECR